MADQGWAWNPTVGPHSERLTHHLIFPRREAGLQLSTWIRAPANPSLAEVHTLGIWTSVQEPARILRTTWPLQRVVFPTEPLAVQLEKDELRSVHSPARAIGALTGRRHGVPMQLGWNLSFEGPPSSITWELHKGIPTGARYHGHMPRHVLRGMGTLATGEKRTTLREVIGNALHEWGNESPRSSCHLVVPRFRELDASLLVHGIQPKGHDGWVVRGTFWDGNRAYPFRGTHRPRPDEGAYTWHFQARGKGIHVDGQAVLPGRGLATFAVEDRAGGSKHAAHASSVASAHLQVKVRESTFQRRSWDLGAVRGASVELLTPEPLPGLTDGPTQ